MSHITLGILTRNRPDDLRRALEAATTAELPPDDVLVSDDSDDGDADRTAAVVAAFPGVRYIRGPRRGLGANENHIVSHLRPESEWVVFNGDDARLAPEFMPTLRQLLASHAPRRSIPTGSEMRNGVWVVPRGLSFFGFQEVPYASYEPGAPVDAIVVQATPFPAAELARVRWLEVSLYGYDEVDMAAKMRRLGWTFSYQPELWLHHDQADAGRSEYPAPLQIARLYYRLRSFSVYDRRPLALAAFLILAPLHLVAGAAKRRDWQQVRDAPRLVTRAYVSWWRSLRADWRTT
jgi:GT2 family glycosyltransferase